MALTDKRFGNREVCDVHFIRQSGIGPDDFWIKSAKMTTLEGAATTVYAQGGKGNSRLVAWEGEKTLTFTVEDALISFETFSALTGTERTSTNNGSKFVIKTTSFAGVYKVEADTLFRDETGVDYAARITIPRAKLQTSLSLSMAPTGDPSTFTFTMDALADNEELFTLEIFNDDEIPTDTTAKTILHINGIKYETTAETVSLSISEAGVISATDANIPSTVALGTGESLTDFDVELKAGNSITLKTGSNSSWYIV